MQATSVQYLDLFTKGTAFAWVSRPLCICAPIGLLQAHPDTQCAQRVGPQDAGPPVGSSLDTYAGAQRVRLAVTCHTLLIPLPTSVKVGGGASVRVEVSTAHEKR